MTAYQTQKILIHEGNNLPIYGTLYQNSTSQKNDVPTIFYLHGGGLIFGQRDDLPDQYITMLTEAGYNLFTVDYPLAPASKLPEILTSIEQSITWFVNNAVDTLHLGNNDFILMGRSAGAYLALYQAIHHEVPAKGLIAFYGYFNLNEAAFNVPSRYFLSFQKVTDAQINQLTNNQPITQGDMNQRYPIYIGARQQGNWQNLYLESGQSAKDFSIPKNQLDQLPVTFITAATNDPDVPSRQSKLLHKSHQASELHMIESDQHDFDRTEVDKLGIPIYEKLIVWLDEHFG